MLNREIEHIYSFVKRSLKGRTQERNIDMLMERGFSLKTYRAIATEHGLTTERVRQICTSCVHKLNGHYTVPATYKGFSSSEKIDVQLGYLDLPINSLNFSTRLTHCLLVARCKILKDVLKTDAATLLSYKNFGQKSLQELREKLAEIGFRLLGE